MSAWWLGIGFGFTAGISPGPLLTLVITATLERGFGAGLRVALAPFLTDLPIIVLTLLFLQTLPPAFLALVFAGGGLFVLYLGVETVRHAATSRLAIAPVQGAMTQDLWRGTLVNLFSPHPWLFWLSVGGPLVSDLVRASWTQGALFLFGFYGLLVGSKIAIAAGIAGGRRYLSEGWYRRILLFSGGLLGLLGIGLLLDAVTRLKVGG
jgi:threonine/homoserine/homoserine lactone efflux protein